MPHDVGDGGSPHASRRCRPALGTYVEVTIHDRGEHHDAFAAAFDAIARIAALMSFHDADSELSRLNATAGERPLHVHPWLFELLTEAAALHEATDRVFDCTIARHLVASGLLPGHDATTPVDGDATFADVVLADGTVAFTRPLALDLGGIAKGYAVDRAIDALRAHGVRSAVVNAGGDLRVLGSSAVPVHVRGADGRPFPAGMLADGALATSRAYDPSRAGPSQSPSALVDPATGIAMAGDDAWSVLAPLAVHADALTKALAISGFLPNACLRRFGATPVVH